MRISNPYYNVGPIDNPELFFNRSSSIETILGGLFSDKPMCRSIVGQRKIGKSSLARHLCRRSTVEQYGYSTDNHLSLYLSCQTDRSMLTSKGAFFATMIDLLLAEPPDFLADMVARINAQTSGSQPWRVWAALLKELWKHRAYVTVVFDEFDLAIAQKTLIEEGLFGSLRGYANDNPNFAWITCTNRYLHVLFQEAFDEYQISPLVRRSESDFFNIAPTHVLTLFDDEDVDQILDVPTLKQQVRFSEDERAAIIRFGGHFPYFIQRACFHFFSAQAAGATNPEYVVRECVREARDLWEAFWNRLDSHTQKLLSDVARQEPITATSSEQANLLETCLVYEDWRGVLRPFSKEFESFILALSPTRSFTIQVGQWLDDRYQVRALPHTTSHSRIAKAWDRRWQRAVAIKFVYRPMDQNPEIIKALDDHLLREAGLLSGFDHPHIGRVYDIIIDPLGVVMEWVEGTSLADYLQAGQSVSPMRAIQIGLMLADALAYLHERNCVHRDVKPSNIIQGLDGTIKLIDFDIARASGVATISMSETGSVIYVGTPDFSAPEQLCRQVLGPPADLFALGVVLYRLLTHELPYKLGNHPEYYEGGRFPPLERHNMPEPLFEVLCGLLAQDPDDRPSAVDLKDQLQGCKAAAGIQ